MSAAYENSFERYDLDPASDPSELTRRLRELAEDASADADERARIRAAWTELTLHPVGRLRAVLGAFPETRPPLPAVPPARPLVRSASSGGPLALVDLVGLPSLCEVLDPTRRPPLEPTSLAGDPVLHGEPHVR